MLFGCRQLCSDKRKKKISHDDRILLRVNFDFNDYEMKKKTEKSSTTFRLHRVSIFLPEFVHWTLVVSILSSHNWSDNFSDPTEASI